MNVQGLQTHVSGQISGQVPNQNSNQLSGLPQQNGNTFHTQVQNMGGHNVDVEVYKMRRFMRDKMYDLILIYIFCSMHPSLFPLKGLVKEFHHGVSD